MPTLKWCINIRGEERIWFFFFICILVSALGEVVDKHTESQTQLTRLSLTSAEQRITSALDLPESPGCAWLPSPQGHTAGFMLFYSQQQCSVIPSAFSSNHTARRWAAWSLLSEINFWGGISFIQADLNNMVIFSLKFSSSKFFKSKIQRADCRYLIFVFFSFWRSIEE